MNINVILFSVVAFYARFCRSQGAEEFVAGSRYMQGIVRYCSMLHNTNTEDIVKTYTSDTNDHNAKCAIMCMLQSAQLMDQNGNFQEEQLQQILNKIPDVGKKTEIENTLKDCLDESSPDPCDKAFVFTKCVSKLKDLIPHIPIPSF